MGGKIRSVHVCVENDSSILLSSPLFLQFCNDVYLMFDNAWSYNRKTSRVYRYCTKLSEVFEATINDAMQSLGYCCGYRVGSRGPRARGRARVCRKVGRGRAGRWLEGERGWAVGLVPEALGLEGGRGWAVGLVPEALGLEGGRGWAVGLVPEALGLEGGCHG